MPKSEIEKKEIVVYLENLKAHVILFIRDEIFEKAVIHRGNQSLFVSSADFSAFVDLMNEARMALSEEFNQSGVVEGHKE